MADSSVLFLDFHPDPKAERSRETRSASSAVAIDMHLIKSRRVAAFNGNPTR